MVSTRPCHVSQTGNNHFQYWDVQLGMSLPGPHRPGDGWPGATRLGFSGSGRVGLTVVSSIVTGPTDSAPPT